MCEKRKGCPINLDKCLRNFIQELNTAGFFTVGCCCGHLKYPTTIVCKKKFGGEDVIFELISGKIIPRKRRFYKKDEEGYYYIPEVVDG